MSELSAPKVFVCHASEDKDRFVTQFAKHLRDNGVDAWLDKWEIFPGDSVVDKIFEEGLKAAGAVIVILSQYSVSKPWVKEELNTSIVARINRQTKIIPVVIDDCEVPEALQSTRWERVDNVSDYDASLERIIQAIFQHQVKPPLGNPPAYATVPVEVVNDLALADSLILKLLGDTTVQQEHDFMTLDQILVDAAHLEIGDEDLLDSLEVLASAGYLEITRVAGGVPRGIGFVSFTSYGFHQYASAYVLRFDGLWTNVAMQLLNYGAAESDHIANALGQPIYLINHVLQQFAARDWITFVHAGNQILILSTSAAMKRQFN